MSYYAMPDIPANADPELRRFCEQVRSTIATLEKYGQAIEVHELITEPPSYNATDTLDEIPVYRAEFPVELVSATWTVPFAESVHHDISIYLRDPGASGSELVQQIASGGAGTTDWAAYNPKRFSETAKARKISKGQILTLAIVEQVASGTEPWGLLSMYLRRAEAA